MSKTTINTFIFHPYIFKGVDIITHCYTYTIKYLSNPTIVTKCCKLHSTLI